MDADIFWILFFAIGGTIVLPIICFIIYLIAGTGEATPGNMGRVQKWYDNPPPTPTTTTDYTPAPKAPDSHFVEKVLTYEALDSIWNR